LRKLPPLGIGTQTTLGAGGARLPLSHDGELVFRHACKMGLEGIVSKRLGSRYRSGRSKDWLKSRTRPRLR
jgi:ATP-dependent DNA ligase